jgi:hypothetical protein
MTDSDPDSITISNQSGGADLHAQGDIHIGGDVVGRDKIESAGGHIIHAAPGATVIVGDTHIAPVSGEPPQVDQRDVDKALQEYRQYMRDRYSTTRLIGKPQPVPIDGIFTDVYLLDHPTAWRRFDLKALEAEHARRGILSHDGKRLNALDVASQQDRLFILGKPGAGKTTLLKYLTFQAASGKLDRVPIFISLNEWAGSGLQLLPFIQRQFEVCDFPDTADFVKQLLKRGGALICFDGLDEVNEVDDQRTVITRAIADFTNQYSKNKHLITCRIAATNYTFEKFTYVEIADFTPDQVLVFARNWFGQDEDKAKRFADELERPEHRGLGELTQTPLLLTLLCLAFETSSTFPAKRAELYEEALDALLMTWDASRLIQRDEVYHGLSLDRKRELLSWLAAEYFEQGEIFFQQKDLAQRVGAFLTTLPGIEAADEPDGSGVIKATEAQHGIFVERAHRIYSFSHLTVQEYFTARHIVEHVVNGALERLITQHLSDGRWREVFLLTASMLPTEAATAFFTTFQHTLDAFILDDAHLLDYGRWAAIKALDYAYLGHPAIARAAARSVTTWLPTRACNVTIDLGFASARAHDLAIDLGLERNLAIDLGLERNLAIDLARVRDWTNVIGLMPNHSFGRTLSLDLDLALIHSLSLNIDLALIYVWLFARARFREGVARLLPALVESIRHQNSSELQQALSDLELPAKPSSSEGEWNAYAAGLYDLLIRHRNIGHEWNFTRDQQKRLDQYERGTVFLAECLKLATVSDRKAIEDRLLLPPEG